MRTKTKIQSSSNIEKIIQRLNRVGGTPKLDMLRQDYKYHNLLDMLRGFVQEYEFYPDDLDKLLKRMRSEVPFTKIRKYLTEYQVCNEDDFWLDFTIITVYRTLCEWIGADGETRLNDYLEGSYGAIQVALSMLGIAEENRMAIKTKADAEKVLANPQVRDEAKMDAVADKLLQPVSKATFEQPKLVSMKEAAETWNEIPEQKRKWYFDRCQKLLPFIASVGRDFGDYQCSEEIVNYWKLRNSYMSVGEIWLKCALDYWGREEKESRKENS